MQIIFLLGLFLLPFVYFPFITTPFELPKVWFFDRWVELMVIFSVFYPPPNKRLNVQVLLIALLFITFAALSSLWSVNLIQSIFGNYWRADGIITLFHLFGLSIVVALYWQESLRKPLVYTVAFSSYFLGLGGLVFNYLGNNSGPFGQENFLAGYLLISLPFLVWACRYSASQTDRVIWIAGITSVLFDIFFTHSWAGLFGALLYFAVLVYNRKKLFILPFVALFITGFFFWYPEATMVYGPKNNYIAEQRLRIYTKGVGAAIAKPLFGWGWANFDSAFNSVNWPLRFNRDAYVDRAHSVLLETLVATGVFGLALYVLLAVQVFFNLLKWQDTLFLSVLTLYLFHSQTNVISINEDLFFWILVGVSAAKVSKV